MNLDEFESNRFNPLSPCCPEDEFCRLEGVDPERLKATVNESHPRVSGFKKLIEKVFTATVKKLPPLVEQSLAEGFDVFLQQLDTLRDNSSLKNLNFPWEDWYKTTYDSESIVGVKGKPHQKEMIVKYIQSFGLSEELILKLADQAPTEELRDSWIIFNADLQKYISEWLSKLPTLFSSQLLKSGLLVSAGQNPNLSVMVPFIGLMQSQIEGRTVSTAFNIINEFYRLPAELTILFKQHKKLLQRSLSSFSNFPLESKLAEDIFLGNKTIVELVEIWSNIVSTLLGYLAAQIFTADSPVRLTINLIETAITFAITYGVLEEAINSSDDSWANKFTEKQAELTAALNLYNKQVDSTSIQDQEELENTRQHVAKLREELVEFIQDHNIQAESTKNAYPWYLAIARQLINQLKPNINFLTAGSFINAALIMQAASPLLLAAERVNFFSLAKESQIKLQDLLEHVEKSSLQIPSFNQREQLRKQLDMQYGGEVTPKQLKLAWADPIVIEELQNKTSTREVSIESQIVLKPGFTLIKAPSGTGKSELLRLIGLLQGNINKIKPTLNDIDLRRLPTKQWLKITKYVEAVNPNTEMTIAESMSVFLTAEDDNAFKEKVAQLEQDRHELDSVFNKSQQELNNEIKNWVNDPKPNHIFTLAFFELMNECLFDLNNVQEASEYLMRKPGSGQGTSTGEGQRFEIFKALMDHNIKLLLLDEPTANLDESIRSGARRAGEPMLPEKAIGHSSYDQMLNTLRKYHESHPDTIILIASNDPRLEKDLQNMIDSKTAGQFNKKYIEFQVIENCSAQPGLVTWQAKEEGGGQVPIEPFYTHPSSL